MKGSYYMSKVGKYAFNRKTHVSCSLYVEADTKREFEALAKKRGTTSEELIEDVLRAYACENGIVITHKHIIKAIKIIRFVSKARVLNYVL